MKKRVSNIIGLVWLVIGIGVLTASCVLNGTNADATQENDAMSVCGVTDGSFAYGDVVTVKGRVRGFHYLIMTDSACETPDRALILVLDREQRASLVQSIADQTFEHNEENFDALVLIEGTLSKRKEIDKSGLAIPAESVNPGIENCLIVSEIVSVRTSSGNSRPIQN